MTRAAREAEDPFAIVNATNTLTYSYLIPQGRLEEAEKLLRRAIGIQAGEASVNALSNLGIVLFERGMDEDALQCFSKVLAAEDGPFDEAREYIERINARRNSAPASTSTQAMKFCPECGTARPSGNSFCGNCGFKFPA